MDAGTLGDAAADGVHVTEAFHPRAGDDHGGTRRKRMHILDGVEIEIDLIGNAEPHLGLGPARKALDVEVVIDVYVVGGAVASAGATAEGKGGDQIVVDPAERTDRARRIYDDASRVHHLAEFADDVVIAGEDRRGVAEAAVVVHVDAQLERLVGGFRANHREHGKEFFNRQRVFVPYALNRGDQ